MAIIPGRQQAHPEKPFALFLIGMRVNTLWAVNRWGPVAMAMPRMQRELAKKPGAGMLWQKNFSSGRTTQPAVPISELAVPGKGVGLMTMVLSAAAGGGGPDPSTTSRPPIGAPL